jgi:hypothetical protein
MQKPRPIPPTEPWTNSSKIFLLGQSSILTPAKLHNTIPKPFAVVVKCDLAVSIQIGNLPRCMKSLVGETHGERATTTTTTTRLRATLIQRKRLRPESSEFIDITKNLQNTTVPTLSKQIVMEILRIHRCNLNLQNTNFPTLSKHVVMEILRTRRYY